jgi:hypothetical protein
MAAAISFSIDLAYELAGRHAGSNLQLAATC